MIQSLHCPLRKAPVHSAKNSIRSKVIITLVRAEQKRGCRRLFPAAKSLIVSKKQGANPGGPGVRSVSEKNCLLPSGNGQEPLRVTRRVNGSKKEFSVVAGANAHASSFQPLNPSFNYHFQLDDWYVCFGGVKSFTTRLFLLQVSHGGTVRFATHRGSVCNSIPILSWFLSIDQTRSLN